MEITTTFNNAAGGPTSNGTTSEAPSPQGPAPSGASAEFQAAVTAVTETVPSVQSIALVPATPQPTPAAAELETLESGRPKPTPRNNFNPPTKVMKASHTPIERHREARIRALQAYALQDRHEAHHSDLGDDLELSF